MMPTFLVVFGALVSAVLAGALLEPSALPAEWALVCSRRLAGLMPAATPFREPGPS